MIADIKYLVSQTLFSLDYSIALVVCEDEWNLLMKVYRACVNPSCITTNNKYLIQLKNLSQIKRISPSNIEIECCAWAFDEIIIGDEINVSDYEMDLLKSKLRKHGKITKTTC